MLRRTSVDLVGDRGVLLMVRELSTALAGYILRSAYTKTSFYRGGVREEPILGRRHIPRSIAQ